MLPVIVIGLVAYGFLLWNLKTGVISLRFGRSQNEPAHHHRERGFRFSIDRASHPTLFWITWASELVIITFILVKVASSLGK